MILRFAYKTPTNFSDRKQAGLLSRERVARDRIGHIANGFCLTVMWWLRNMLIRFGHTALDVVVTNEAPVLLRLLRREP